MPISGYGDWPTLRHEMELRHIKLQEHEFGPFESNQDVWFRCSPFYDIINATTPCFVVWGEGKDPRSDASRAFAEEMKRLYKTVEAKAYPNDGYYVDPPPNLRQLRELSILRLDLPQLRDDVAILGLQPRDPIAELEAQLLPIVG